MLDEIVDALIAAGLAENGAVFIAHQPSDPVKALIVRRYGGSQPTMDFDNNVIEPATVQFMFRAATWPEAEDWAQQVFVWCYGAGSMIGVDPYVGLTPRGPILDAGEDENFNTLITLNVDVLRQSVAQGVGV